MVNPYLCYAAGFSFALAMYLLRWSDLYPSLSVTVSLFLFLTIIVHVYAGIRPAWQKINIFRKLETQSDLAPVALTILLYALWCTEFLYARGVPFISILLGKSYDYKLFGIPTLHVFIVTFSSFYTVYLFHLYLSKRSFRILFLYVINLLSAILIYNRGMFLFNLSASAFLFLIYTQNISVKQVALGISGIVIFLFLFGVLGTLRVSNESRKPYSNELFLRTGHASQSFRDSPLPSEFFWSYVYMTSPLANLERNISVSEPPPLTGSTFLKWMNNELLFDFISKRINRLASAARVKENNIPGPFNATTVYSGSFSHLGWWGMFLMAGIILLIPQIYMKMIPPASPFFLSGLVIVNTVFLFMVFDNTVRFTGLSFQIVYPVLLNQACQRFEWLKKIFL